jgi:hypothetical protein
MSALQGFLLGIMVFMTPSMLLLGVVLLMLPRNRTRRGQPAVPLKFYGDAGPSL